MTLPIVPPGQSSFLRLVVPIVIVFLVVNKLIVRTILKNKTMPDVLSVWNAGLCSGIHVFAGWAETRSSIKIFHQNELTCPDIDLQKNG